MRFIIEDAVRILKEGNSFVLSTIMECQGSAPRGLGAAMLVEESGKQFGTIGGGAVEFAAGKRAMELLTCKGSESQFYRLHPNEAADLGMICGGQVLVLFEHFAPDTKTIALFERLQQARLAGECAYLVRRIENGAAVQAAVLDKTGLHGDLDVDAQFVQDHAGKRPCLVELENDSKLLLEPVGKGDRVFIFGGGHVSQKLVPVLSYVGFRVTVCEDRPEFANKALFPAAEGTVLHAFAGIVEHIGINGDDYLVVMTRGHLADYEILRQALKTPATYIGCIGSKHKVALTKKRLLEEGFTEEDFARIHTPIGLPIGAETPEEIAISVTAQMVAHRAKN